VKESSSSKVCPYTDSALVGRSSAQVCDTGLPAGVALADGVLSPPPEHPASTTAAAVVRVATVSARARLRGVIPT
jgi:hypothetical protein